MLTSVTGKNNASQTSLESLKEAMKQHLQGKGIKEGFCGEIKKL